MRTTRSEPCPRRSRFVTPRLGDAIDSDSATGVGIVDRRGPGERLRRRHSVGHRRSRSPRRGSSRRPRPPGEILLGEETERLVRGRARVERGGDRGGPRLEASRPRARTAGGRLVEGAARRPRARGRPAPAGVRAGRLASARCTCSRSSGRPGSESRDSRRSSLRSPPNGPAVLVGRCVPYGEGITFWSLREIVGELTAAGPNGALLPDGHEARPLADSLQEAIGDAGAVWRSRGDLLGDPKPLRGTGAASGRSSSSSRMCTGRSPPFSTSSSTWPSG